MSRIAITVDGLSKRYRIGTRERVFRTFREAIIEGIKAPVNNLSKSRKLTKLDSGNSDEDIDIIWSLTYAYVEITD